MTDTTMNTGAAIEPCPFCGSTNIETTVDEMQGTKWGFAECGCSACGPEVRTAYNTRADAPWRQDAIAAWNDRATTPQADADFKNFHRLLCERFDYVHDEGDWKRDQLSLIEHIASRAAIAAGGAQEVAAPESAMDKEMEWHWSTSDEGPMYPAYTDDVTEALSHALYESGITTFGEDQTTIFLCRFRPLNIDWKHHADWLLEHIDDTVIDYVAEGDIPTDQTDADALASALASIVKVNAIAAYDNRQYSPGDSEYETALSRGRNDEAAAKRASPTGAPK